MKQTSIEARNNYLKNGSDKKDYSKILAVLEKSNEPLTFKEIAAKQFMAEQKETQKHHFTMFEVINLLFRKNYASNVGRRLNEMVHKEMILEASKRPCTITGKNCFTYTLKSE